MDNLDQTTGKIKQTVGDLTGNTDLEREGKADERAGNVKEVVERAADKVEHAVDKAKALAEDAHDKVEHAVDKTEDKPTSH